jgi:hypothetical protein
MAEKVFLFGAGASFGAGHIRPEKPPLGYDLYDELCKSYPGSWGSFPDKHKAVFRINFEAGMDMVYKEYGGVIPQLMREMAVYFIQFYITNDRCAYVQLVAELDKRDMLTDTVFSTINYECILESAINRIGHSIDYFSNASNGIRVFKLHGSCNMYSKAVHGGQGIRYGTGVSFEGGIQVMPSKDDVIRHCLCETGLAPVMNLYMRGKPLSVSGGSIQAIQQEWANCVNNAKSVVCIGVNPVVEDNHIWGPIAATAGQLIFVGNKSAFEKWDSTKRKGASKYVGSKFEANILNIMGEI